MAECQHDTTECGFCLRKKEELAEPKKLPCNHTHCLQCLTGFYEENNVLVCPVSECGEIYEGSPDALPSCDVVADDIRCDVCVSNNLAVRQAVIYCTYCCKKFCSKHQESDDDALSDHPKISMQEYRAEAMKKQTRTCAEHEDHPFVMGCKLCLNVICMKCLPDLAKCDNGASHSLLSLDDLVTALIKEDISAEMTAKEDQYEKLFKETSKARAVYDNETAEMVQLIHNTRDAQIDALKLKYKTLEDELMERRQKSRVDLAEFMEDIVLKKWTQLRNQRQLIESRVKRSHKVDVVKGLKELKAQMLKFVEEELPKLKVTDEVQLKRLDVNREMELEIVPSGDMAIDSEHGLTRLLPIPQSATFLKSVKLRSSPYSVCQYNGSTYIGLSNKTVTRIDNNYRLRNSFISTSGPVESISVYKDKFYTLSKSNPREVNVYDTSGGHITSWTHPYHSNGSNMLTVVADQVVVADPINQRITVYSLTGESLRHIPCPLLSDTHITLCAVDNTSVVISNRRTSKVFRVNLSTGDVMWTLSEVNNPLGLVPYGGFILLSTGINKTTYILNTATGNIMSEISKVADDMVFGMEVYGTTLVVPKQLSQQACFYQLK